MADNNSQSQNRGSSSSSGSGSGSGSMTVEEAGRKGGEATKQEHGPEFYSKIGEKGGKARAQDQDVKSGELGRQGANARWNKDSSGNGSNSSGNTR